MRLTSADQTAAFAPPEAKVGGARRWVGLAIPSFISASSDVDPTSIGTLAVVGSTVAFGLNWLLLATLPLLAGQLMLATKVGLVSRQGLQDLITKRFPASLVLLSAVALVAVNLVTLGADIGAGAAALGLLTHLDRRFFVVPFAAGIGVVLQFAGYRTVKRILIWPMLVLIAYFGAAFAAHPDWGQALFHTFVPHFHWTSSYVNGTLALVGGTMTGYVYFWQSMEESEEGTPVRDLPKKQAAAPLGILWTSVIFFFILVATGATLGKSGVTAETADQAARALEPIAGHASSLLFAVGLLASAALAVPVLAVTAAQVVAATAGWRSGLDLPTGRTSLPYYGIIWASLGIGCIIPLFGIPAITLLFYSSIAGAIGLPVQLAMLLFIAQDKDLMGDHKAGIALALLGLAGVLVSTLLLALLIAEPFVL